MALDRFRSWIWLLGCLPIGCGSSTPELPKIHVAAASDLQSALPVLISAFRLEHEIEVVPTFGASGQLAEQIRQGAPFDLFLSADRKFVDKLAEDGQVNRDSVQPYALGSLVLAVNKTIKIPIDSMAGLKQPEILKIAMANPETAPYGRAAKQAIERSGLWDDLKPKLVVAESVRQALQMAQTGNADVAIVGKSIADVREVRSVGLPADSYDPIVQYLGIVTSAEHSDDVRLFRDFVLGDVGQAILRRMGFRRPGSTSEPSRGSAGGPTPAKGQP